MMTEHNGILVILQDTTTNNESIQVHRSQCFTSASSVFLFFCISPAPVNKQHRGECVFLLLHLCVGMGLSQCWLKVFSNSDSKHADREEKRKRRMKIQGSLSMNVEEEKK